MDYSDSYPNGMLLFIVPGEADIQGVQKKSESINCKVR